MKGKGHLDGRLKGVVVWIKCIVNNLKLAMLDIMIIRTLFNKGSRVPLRGKVNEEIGLKFLLQPMDDGLKLVKNEVIIPKKSSCILFLVVPNLFFATSYEPVYQSDI